MVPINSILVKLGTINHPQEGGGAFSTKSRSLVFTIQNPFTSIHKEVHSDGFKLIFSAHLDKTQHCQAGEAK